MRRPGLETAFRPEMTRPAWATSSMAVAARLVAVVIRRERGCSLVLRPRRGPISLHDGMGRFTHRHVGVACGVMAWKSDRSSSLFCSSLTNWPSLTPGSSPACAISRRAGFGQRPNLRYTECDDRTGINNAYWFSPLNGRLLPLQTMPPGCYGSLPSRRNGKLNASRRALPSFVFAVVTIVMSIPWCRPVVVDP